MNLLITIAVISSIPLLLATLSWLADINQKWQSYEKHNRFLEECSRTPRTSKKQRVKDEAILNEFNELMKKRYYETLDRG
jgi:hypothetical protein